MSKGIVSRIAPTPAELAAQAQLAAMTKDEKLAMMRAQPAQWNELCRLKARAESFNPSHNFGIKTKAERRMRGIDAMDPSLRDAVNRHGLGVVQAFVDHGVTTVRAIDYLIDCVRNINDGRPANYGNHRTKAIRMMDSPL